jgi:hypothetical protein
MVKISSPGCAAVPESVAESVPVSPGWTAVAASERPGGTVTGVKVKGGAPPLTTVNVWLKGSVFAGRGPAIVLKTVPGAGSNVMLPVPTEAVPFEEELDEPECPQAESPADTATATTKARLR